MEQLKEAVKLAAKLHENSWVINYGDESPGYYTLSIKEAANEATKQLGLNEDDSEPIYLLLQHCWNDTLDWAGRK
jgi:hypothetical protein